MQEDSYRGDPNDPLSLNLYTYCYNEPVMYTDPTGHMRVGHEDLDRESGRDSKSSTANTAAKTAVASSKTKKSTTSSSKKVIGPIVTKVASQISGNIMTVGMAGTLAVAASTKTNSTIDKQQAALSIVISAFMVKLATDGGNFDIPLKDNPKSNLETMTNNEKADINGADDLPVQENKDPNLTIFPLGSNDESKGLLGIPLQQNRDKCNVKDATQEEDEAKPYSHSRPAYGKGQVEQVWEDAKQSDGKVYDPNTGEELTWDKTKSRNGKWDMGHTSENKYSEWHEKYMNGEITKEEFLDWYRNSDNYRPESPAANRGRKYEK